MVRKGRMKKKTGRARRRDERPLLEVRLDKKTTRKILRWARELIGFVSSGERRIKVLMIILLAGIAIMALWKEIELAGVCAVLSALFIFLFFVINVTILRNYPSVARPPFSGTAGGRRRRRTTSRKKQK